MKVIKESTIGTLFEVGLVPAGNDRYTCLEELLQNFESFEGAKDFVDNINMAKYEGYDVVVVTAKKNTTESDKAWQSEVYRREGTKLTEGPIGRFFNGIGKSAEAKAKMEREDKEKSAQKKADKILATDFSSKAKNWKYYIPEGNGKYSQTPMTNRDFLAKYGNAVVGTEEYKARCDALVLDDKGDYVRRGLEWLEGQRVKADVKNPKIKQQYTHNEVFVDDAIDDPAPTPTPPGTPTPPTTPTPSGSGTIDEKTIEKFAILAKATGIKVFGARGSEVTRLDRLKKIPPASVSKCTVEVAGKRIPMQDYIELLQKNKLVEDVTLTEKVWKHTINKDLAFKLRDILEADDTDYEALRDTIKACYDDIHTAMPEVFDEDDCEDAKEELDWLSTSVDDSDADFDDPEYMDDDNLESEWNYALENLYDLCDGLNIWIPVRGIDEDIETTSDNIKLGNNTIEVEKPDTSEVGDENHPIQKGLKGSISKLESINESTLTEAPVVKLNDADLMNPGRVDFKQKIADATAEEEAEKARQAEEARKEQFRTKYKDVPAKLEASLGKGGDAEETLEVLFQDLVPSQGAADTMAGEMVRAMMRVLYRDSNDGDKFFQGYGLETCASSVSYLCAHITTVEKRVEMMLEEAFRYEDDDRYTEALKGMTEDVVDHIMNNQELIFTPNEEDSREYDYSYIEEKQPRYEFECDGSDDVCTLVDNGIINGWDLYHYVEDQLQWDNAYNGAEVERPWGYDSTSITVSNLTVEGYEQLKDSFERNQDGWWEDLVSEHKDELDRINSDDEDYEEDDDIDEGLINARPEIKDITEKLQARSEDLTFLANEFDAALKHEGFEYDIDIVEGFKINVKSDELSDIDNFAHEFFKKYQLAVDIEDKNDSHNYMLKKAATKSDKNEGFLHMFNENNTDETNGLNEEFVTYEDVMEGMMDNASNEQIDADIRLFNKVAKNLGVNDPKNLVIYVDGEGMYDPVYYADSSVKLDNIIAKFNCGPIDCISERKHGNVWIFFRNKNDAEMYINFVNNENGI